MKLYQCPQCREVMEDVSEPCWCVFGCDGEVIDGVLHTPARIEVDTNVLQAELDAHDVANYIAWAKLPNAVRYDREEYYAPDEHAVAFSYLLR